MTDIFAEPVHHQVTPTEADQRARWLPTATAIDFAVAALADFPAAEFAIVPMCQPGKVHGWWQIGQAVETAEGIAYPAMNGWESRDGVPPLHAATAAAEAHADAMLGDREGTVAHAVVYRDGHAAVFEGYRPAELAAIRARHQEEG